MTSQEARQQLNDCESRITSTYSNLLYAARSVGSSATQAASSKTTTSTLLPLLISLFGLLLIDSVGIIFIIAGIVIAYNAHKSAAYVQKNVETQVRYLNSELDRYSKI